MIAPNRTALVLGATGLVGEQILKLLLEDDRWTEVVTLGRRGMEPVAPQHAHHLVDFDNLEDHAAHFACDDVFCCIGTTIKKAGSEDAFRRVDFHYPLAAARLARAHGARQYMLVSALGANPKSRIFYNRVKGEVERAVADVGFESLGIFRPSLLTGERRERRPLEALSAKFITALRPLLSGRLRKYRATPADVLAHAMTALAAEPREGVTVYEADAIMAHGRET